LVRVVEEAKSEDYLDAIEQVEPEVNELAEKVVGNLTVNIPPPDDSA
jgi:hypothetical protein